MLKSELFRPNPIKDRGKIIERKPFFKLRFWGPSANHCVEICINRSDLKE